jgi:hypothetical protein
MKYGLKFLLLIFLGLTAHIHAGPSKPSPIVTDPMPGAPVPVYPADPRVVAVLDFALATGYPLHSYTNTSIISATQQIVNGLYYEMVVAVQFPASCVVVVMGVWQRASPPGWFLSHHKLLDIPCKDDQFPVPEPEPSPFSISYSFSQMRLRR